MEALPDQGKQPKQDLYVTEWPVTAMWQRRRTETDPSWMSFLAFLSLIPGQRTIARAHAISGGNTANGARAAAPGSLKQMQRWSAMHKWAERAIAYDRWKQERDIINDEVSRSAETAKWAEIRDKERDAQLEMGRALMEKAKAMLQFPLAQVERVTQVYEDGRAREVQIFKPGAWRFGDIARLVDIGAKLIRLSAEMETDRKLIDLRIVRAEAEEIARKYDLDPDDLLAMADQIAEEHWGATSGKYDTLDRLDD
jgi:hypothetical protein